MKTSVHIAVILFGKQSGIWTLLRWSMIVHYWTADNLVGKYFFWTRVLNNNFQVMHIKQIIITNCTHLNEGSI